jgi:TatD DNase family protein
MNLVDSHCHLNFSDFEKEYKEIIADCVKKEIGILNVASDYSSSKRNLEISLEFREQNIFASIGVHPTDFLKLNKFNKKDFQNLIDQDKAKKIIAIGEIGLDYFHMPDGFSFEELKQKQKSGLISQIELALKNNLPVILHGRGSKDNPQDAYQDLIEIVKKYEEKSLTGVVHCYGSSLEIAQEFIQLGFYIGFTGIITFKNKSVDNLRQVVKEISLDKILIETDAPFLSPEPYRGQKNMPQYTEYVAQKIAELKDIPLEKVKEQTTKNFINLFKI